MAVGAVVAGTALTGAQAAPSLPARTPAQLLTSVSGPDRPLPPMTAAIQETASLGLPSLPGAGGGQFSPLSLLSGTHTIQLWYADPAHLRVAIPVQLGETDLRRNGRQVWLWDSTRNTATGLTLPAAASQVPAGSLPSASPGTAMTPPQVARQLLAAVGKTTQVGVQRDVMVAGQPAYQLTLAPQDSRSLIGQIRIAIDARRSLPLRVQIFARHASTAAFSVGFTSLTFGRPAAANFAFTPPHGTTVKRTIVPAAMPAGRPPTRGWVVLNPATGQSQAYQSTIRLPKGALAQMRKQLLARLPKGMTRARRQALLRSMARLQANGWTGFPPSKRILLKGPPAGVPVTSGWVGSSSQVSAGGMASGSRVIGTGWLSVLVLPSGAAGQAENAGGDLGAALNAATPVHGSWGSGRLLRTSLVSVLLDSNGKVLVGAVAPSVLYAAAAKAG